MNPLLKSVSLSLTCVLSLLTVHAQTIENFDSRAAVAGKRMQAMLENKCWQFSHFSVQNSTELRIQGDGSIISSSSTASSNLYTPLLDIKETFTVAFNYAFSAASADSRAISIYFTNGSNEIVRVIDNVEVMTAEANKIFHYNKTFSAAPGVYKINISYQAGSSNTQLIIDEINISAGQQYRNGCNQSPKAKADVVTGSSDRTAAGDVSANDLEPNGEKLSSYLINGSRDGKLHLETNGRFFFVPHPGFRGSSTTFTYQVCDEGYNKLCSDIVTVVVQFPDSAASGLTALQANYANRLVTLKWNATNEDNHNRFQVERSVDGIRFHPTGGVAVKKANLKEGDFVFEDRVSEKLTRNNDLFYRVRYTNAQGVASYSKLLLVRVFQTRTLESVSVTPNPAVNDIRVQLQLNEPAFAVIKLRTLNGEELIRKNVKGLKGDNSFAVERSESINKGTYILEVVVNSNERLLMKVIKS